LLKQLLKHLLFWKFPKLFNNRLLRPAAVNASVDPKAAAARTRLVNMINNFEDASKRLKQLKV